MSRTIVYPPSSGGSGSGVSSKVRAISPSLVAPTAVYYPTIGAGELLAVACDIPVACTLQAITWHTGGTSSGNFRLGIFGPTASAQGATGAALVVDSGTVACPATFTQKRQSFSNTPLAAGQYFVVFAFSSAGQTFQRCSEDFAVAPGFIQHAAAAFAALPATLPTMSADDNTAPFYVMEVTPT